MLYPRINYTSNTIEIEDVVTGNIVIVMPFPNSVGIDLLKDEENFKLWDTIVNDVCTVNNGG